MGFASATPQETAEHYCQTVKQDLEDFSEAWRSDYEDLAVNRQWIHENVDALNEDNVVALQHADQALQKQVLLAIEQGKPIKDFMRTKKTDRNLWWFWLDDLLQLSESERCTL